MPNTVPPPNRIPWPPLIFGGAALAAIALGLALPGAGLLPGGLISFLGWALLALGLGLDIAAMITLRWHEANILPHRPATALVTSGIYAWSRNPIYLGNTLMLIGAALAFANPWFLLAAVVAAGAVLPLAILREERHLAARFGAAWQDYRSRTGRWFGRRSDD